MLKAASSLPIFVVAYLFNFVIFRRKIMSKILLALQVFIVLLSILFCGCKEKSAEIQQNQRPVKIISLQTIEPSRMLRLTGSAKAWRQESLAFEVKGRLKSVLDENTEVTIVSQEQQDGNMNIVGQVIAELDTSRYDADVTNSQAQLTAARAEVKAIEIDIEQLTPQDIRRAQETVSGLEITLTKILPADVSRVESQLTLAKQEYARAKELYERNSGTKQAYDKAQNELDAVNASYNQVKANISAKEKELASAQAALAKAKAVLTSKMAQLDVAKAGVQRAQAGLTLTLRNQEDCFLRTPFSGIISSRLVTTGAVVGAGQPVVVVTMMDPIHIEVAVSAEIARNIQLGDPAYFYPNSLGSNQAILGWVEKKSVVADPSTRTYLISCVGRNTLITPRGNEYHPESQNEFNKEDVTMVWNLNHGSANSLMVWTKSILKDKEGYYVWAIKEARLGQQQIRAQKFHVNKVRVELGKEFRSFVKHEYREITKSSGLEPFMLTLRGDFPNLQDNTELSYTPTDWMLRPGDLVQVSFDLGKYPAGVYAPISSILSEGNSQYIFIHENGVAKKVKVTVAETFRDTRRITADIPLAGKELVTEGAHYLKDNDPINATRQEIK